MLKILAERRVSNLDDATHLALREAGRGDLSPDAVSVFALVIDADRLRAEAERSINTAVHTRYGRNARWDGRQWFIPLPQLRYDARHIPRLTITVQGYLVAAITIKRAEDTYHAALLGPAGKAERLILPVSFLQAILDDELE